MNATVLHIKDSIFKVTGYQSFDNGSPNRAVLAVAYIYDPITENSDIRNSTEEARTTTDEFGIYTFERKWKPGDYVIKFYGIGTGELIDLGLKWDYFTIPQIGIYDITPPDNTEIFKIDY